MSKANPPELKKFMDKRLGIQMNGGRNLSGTLRGYDPFMNLVIDECVEKKKNGERRQVERETDREKEINLKIFDESVSDGRTDPLTEEVI